MAPDSPAGAHPTTGEVAGFLDGRASDAERERLEAHLADCAECRTELVEVGRLLRSLTRRGSWLILGAAAAAGIALLMVVPTWLQRAETLDRVRAPATATTMAPRPIAPRGPVDAASQLLWSSVSHADRYRVAVFDHEGAIVWEAQTEDTLIALPDSVSLTVDSAYFWKVWARTALDRWGESSLIEFRLLHPPARK